MNQIFQKIDLVTSKISDLLLNDTDWGTIMTVLQGILKSVGKGVIPGGL